MKHERKILTAADISTGGRLERCVVSGDCSGLVCDAFMCDLSQTTNAMGWTLDKCAMPLAPEEIDAGVESEVQDAVNHIALLSFKYPNKVSRALTGKVDKATTEGLLSANGKKKTIDAPEGW